MPKDSMFYATLEEAIDAAREEFSPTTLTAMKRAPTLSSSTFKSMCCRMAISPGRPNLLLTKRNKANASRVLSGESRRRASSTGIMMR